MMGFDIKWFCVALLFFAGCDSQKGKGKGSNRECRRPKGYPGQWAECQYGKWAVNANHSILVDINNTVNSNGGKLDTLLMRGYADLKDGQCVQDNHSRLFVTFAGSFGDNTPDTCIARCAVLGKDMAITPGFAFAGVQFGSQCFCGQCTLPEKVFLPEEDCNMPCSGDSNLVCGGGYTMNVYATENEAQC